jgi:histidinol-phosphatase (PHP family)
MDMSTQEKTLHTPRQVNLHTHSWYCGHGCGELSQYVEKAKELGLTALGFSEHCPVPEQRWRNSRMEFSQLDRYIAECRGLQESTEELAVLCGFECDHEHAYAPWYKQELLESGKVDYLAFGIHYLEGPHGRETYIRNLPPEKRWLHAYTDAYVDALLSDTYLFGVHPDLFAMFYTRWDEEAVSCSRSILSCAAETGTPLEINGYGFRKPTIFAAEGERLQYPHRSFWELAADHDVHVIVNSDAHAPEDLDIRDLGPYQLAEHAGLALSGWRVMARDEGGYTLRAERC